MTRKKREVCPYHHCLQRATSRTQFVFFLFMYEPHSVRLVSTRNLREILIIKQLTYHQSPVNRNVSWILGKSPFPSIFFLLTVKHQGKISKPIACVEKLVDNVNIHKHNQETVYIHCYVCINSNIYTYISYIDYIHIIYNLHI